MKKPLTLLILSISFFFSCKKSIEEEEIKKAPDFDYATTKDLSINLKFVSADNKPLKYVLVNFYYSGNNNLDPVYKALTDSNGVLRGSFAAPAYKNALTVDLKYPGITRNMTMFFENNALSLTIKATATTASTSSSKNAKTSGIDSDFDSVEDIYDEFPTDPLRAYTKYYPSKNTWGTLAFEDSWPSKGDYDMNDLVLSYNYAIVCDYRGFYVEMNCNYKALSAGAGNTNGFGVNLPYIGLFSGGVSPIASVTGHKITERYNSLNSAGFDPNSINIIPFDNHRSVFNGASGPINAVKGAAKIESELIIVKVKFKYAVNNTLYRGWINTSRIGMTLYDVPFNPFMMCGMKPKYEVHQVGYGPTQSAWNAGISQLFGSGDDAAVPQLYAEFPPGLYRTKDGGKPWVLNFAEGFDYPIETSSVSKAYLHYDEWRAGLGYADWYLDKPGYRNADLIYK